MHSAHCTLTESFIQTIEMVDYVILTMYGSRSEQANRLSRSYVTPRLPLVCNPTSSFGYQPTR
jgi:hypothetical protein